MAIGMTLQPSAACGVRGVVKAEWGTKRICLNCGARFYDMNRDPIICPACSTALDPVVQSRPRRARPAAKLAAVAVVADPVEAEVDDDVESDDDDEAVVVADDEDDDAEEDGESAIEDVSELGDDDMADVIETDLDEEEGER
jgi:uncharacterized protein (TIGR02300 family)